MTLRNDFCVSGKAAFILGGAFGSEGKGACAAFAVDHLFKVHQKFDVLTTNSGSQSGHTSIRDGKKHILFHLPTSAAVMFDIARAENNIALMPTVYLNAGAVIDVDVLLKELKDTGLDGYAGFYIHPNAAIITQDCKEAEGRADSAQTKIASTRKGVGEALARKVLRSGLVARDEPRLKQFIRRIDLNERLRIGQSVLVEVPQGFSLGIDQPFYPHTTSRNCTVAQAASDAGLHPSFVGESMLVIRSFPIRVGHIEQKPFTSLETWSKDEYTRLGHSGGAYPGQRELSWEQLGQTPETTTVTKRVRRVFEFSHQQLLEAMSSARPSIVFLSFCDYLTEGGVAQYQRAIEQAAKTIDLEPPQVFYAYGPSTSDVHSAPLQRKPPVEYTS